MRQCCHRWTQRGRDAPVGHMTGQPRITEVKHKQCCSTCCNRPDVAWRQHVHARSARRDKHLDHSPVPGTRPQYEVAQDRPQLYAAEVSVRMRVRAMDGLLVDRCNTATRLQQDVSAVLQTNNWRNAYCCNPHASSFVPLYFLARHRPGCQNPA